MSQRAANAAIERWPDGRTVPAGAPWAWNYEIGTLLEGMDDVWLATVDPRYFNYIKVRSISSSHPTAPSPRSSLKSISSTTSCSAASSSFSTASRRTSAISPPQRISTTNSRSSRAMLTAATGTSSDTQPDVARGLYMAEPFRAQYAVLSHHPEDLPTSRSNLSSSSSMRTIQKPACSITVGTIEAGALGQQGDGRLVAILGPRHGLVHDGPRRYARLLSRERSRPNPPSRLSCGKPPPPSRTTRTRSPAYGTP